MDTDGAMICCVWGGIQFWVQTWLAFDSIGLHWIGGDLIGLDFEGRLKIEIIGLRDFGSGIVSTCDRIEV